MGRVRHEVAGEGVVGPPRPGPDARPLAPPEPAPLRSSPRQLRRPSRRRMRGARAPRSRPRPPERRRDPAAAAAPVDRRRLGDAGRQPRLVVGRRADPARLLAPPRGARRLPAGPPTRSSRRAWGPTLPGAGGCPPARVPPAAAPGRAPACRARRRAAAGRPAHPGRADRLARRRPPRRHPVHPARRSATTSSGSRALLGTGRHRRGTRSRGRSADHGRTSGRRARRTPHCRSPRAVRRSRAPPDRRAWGHPAAPGLLGALVVAAALGRRCRAGSSAPRRRRRGRASPCRAGARRSGPAPRGPRRAWAARRTAPPSGRPSSSGGAASGRVVLRR